MSARKWTISLRARRRIALPRIVLRRVRAPKTPARVATAATTRIRSRGVPFGEIYKAHKQSIGKSYAIKFLKVDEGAQREAVERELEQVRHFAAIDHPNLVTIEDMGTVLGVPYLVMGYAGELTLAKRLARRDLTRESALSYFIQTCRGVLALHDRRLVHFDLKPANVFLHGDVARVGDYGLSKLMTDGRLTLSFGRGTPHYMAPEMMKGRADHRADIYSLGVLLFESIAAKVPYEIKSTAGIVVREDDHPPEFPEDYPADLRIVTERCLRVSPSDRYDDVAQLLEALGQTARRGDSIRLDPIRPASAARSVADRAGYGSDGTAEETPTMGSASAAAAGELRATAAELTRGAVEVARGVWDGLRTTKTSSGVGVLKSPVQASPGPSDTAADSDSMPAGVPTTVAEPTPVPSPRTIPVPPRASGGPLGTLLSTLRLGAEIFISLLRGLFSNVSRFVSARHRRIVTSPSSRFRRAVRLAGFYLLLFIALAALVNLFGQLTA